MGVELRELAEHMRDQRWLDMRYDDELLQRVRIVEMIVRVEGEDIVLKQEWVNEDAEVKEDYFHRQRIEIDSEGIWKVMPTAYHVSEVQPRGIALTPQAVGDELAQAVLLAVQRSLKFVHHFDDKEWEEMYRCRWEISDARHQGIIVVYEMTDLPPDQICRGFGYKSPQPLMTARWKASISPHNQHESFREGIKRLAKLTEEFVPGQKPRRSVGFPRDYKPVVV